MLSVFDLFTVGIGPSSSHTVGPMVAGRRFCQALRDRGLAHGVAALRVDLYGSLALTGKGHRTDVAVMLGLAGFSPDSVDVDAIEPFLESVQKNGRLPLCGAADPVAFVPDRDLLFNDAALPLHENGLVIQAFGQAGEADEQPPLFAETYYSVGGGFVMTAGELAAAKAAEAAPDDAPLPFVYATAGELLGYCDSTGLSIAGAVMWNELTMRSREAIVERCRYIRSVMEACIARGMQGEGVLPGPLQVPRRAGPLYRLLRRQEQTVAKVSGGPEGMAGRDPLAVLDWVNLFAIAVNEENAAGGRVVTAPTNGASGIIPAVMAYYDRFITPLEDNTLVEFFLTTGAVGLLYKRNASISGAEVGCQGEVGVACSMAAAGLAALLGGTPDQVCIAAEIGMEHNLGLTCDPVAGQVQIPCIERNAIAATKAINAARMALRRSGRPAVSLDTVIRTMLETGKDMSVKYRETSLGGLAAGVRPGAVEC
jgi:L-serine dehydratase, iron-sulfur-dependent, single chain form